MTTSILPNPDAPHHLADQITTTLSQLPGVARITVFGSLATDTADPFSDVDMFVIADDLPSTAWAAARALRLAIPVQFYRMFSTAAQPAGRYWFADQSPLTRLDISFHTQADYQHLLAAGQYLYHPLHTRDLYVNPTPTLASPDISPAPLIITDAETQLGEYIYRTVRAIKNTLRNQPFRYPLPDCITWLNQAVAATPDTHFEGGNGHALAHACIELAHTITTETRV